MSYLIKNLAQFGTWYGQGSKFSCPSHFNSGCLNPASWQLYFEQSKLELSPLKYWTTEAAFDLQKTMASSQRCLSTTKLSDTIWLPAWPGTENCGKQVSLGYLEMTWQTKPAHVLQFLISARALQFRGRLDLELCSGNCSCSNDLAA